jgi:colanic acid biosynthesis glycosyl transferase WcaI
MLASVIYAEVRSAVFGSRTWINVQDLPAEAATETGITRASRPWRWMGAFQRRLILRADVVSSIAPPMVSKIEAYGSLSGAVRLFPNFLKQSIVASVAEHGDERVPLDLGSRPPRLLYAGNIGRKQHLLEYCRQLAASDLSFEFRIFGDGAEADRVKEWLCDLADPRFTTGPFLDEREFIMELLRTDLFVVTETADAGASFVPSKLIPAIAALTPVLAICGCDSALREEVTSHGLGVVGEWDSAMAVTAKAIAMVSDPFEWRTFRDRLRDRQVAYSRDTALDLAEAIASGR